MSAEEKNSGQRKADFHKQPADLLLRRRTFRNDAVHKTHGKAEEDETVQVVHLQDRNVTTVIFTAEKHESSLNSSPCSVPVQENPKLQVLCSDLASKFKNCSSKATFKVTRCITEMFKPTAACFVKTIKSHSKAGRVEPSENTPLYLKQKLLL